MSIERASETEPGASHRLSRVGESVHYARAVMTAEVMHAVLEDECDQGYRHRDEMMMRLKDLSAYSLTHADILDQREGVELLALAMFFGATSDPRYHGNQTRLARLSPEALHYQGQAELIERDVALRKGKRPTGKRVEEEPPIQTRLL